MYKTNVEIRKAIVMADLKHWQVADKLGIHEGSLCRKLRHELNDEEKQHILSIIEELKGGEA